MNNNDNPKYKQQIAWIDLVFNMMMAFAFLFVLSFVQIAVAKKDAQKIDPKAEMMIQMTWPDNAVEDIDLWLRLPDGTIVSFKNKSGGLANLERDDRGTYGDQVETPTGPVHNPINKEVIMIRGLVPGTYTVNVIFYSDMKNYPHIVMGHIIPDEPNLPKPPYKVKVELSKLNPSYKEIAMNEVVISTPNEERTAFSFTITETGAVVDINKFDRPFGAASSLQDGAY